MRTITITINIEGDDLEHCNCKVKECDIQFNLHEVCDVIGTAQRALCHYWSDDGEWEHPLVDANGNRCGRVFSTLSDGGERC